MFKINGTQLKLALKEIVKAEKNGFFYCEAVFVPNGVDGIFIKLRYSDMHEKAHPTDARLDWGRGQAVTRQNKFKKGKLIRIKK